MVAVVGRAAPGTAGAIADYERRAARYWDLEVREVRAARPAGHRPENARDDDWKRLLLARPAQAQLWVCDERGRSMSSVAFAETLGRRRDAGESVMFAIGGAYGLPEEARHGADVLLALSPWTLPHDLARLVLAEQLYRAGTILRHEPYHK